MLDKSLVSIMFNGHFFSPRPATTNCTSYGSGRCFVYAHKSSGEQIVEYVEGKSFIGQTVITLCFPSFLPWNEYIS